jgi:hypothetical protein
MYYVVLCIYKGKVGRRTGHEGTEASRRIARCTLSRWVGGQRHAPAVPAAPGRTRYALYRKVDGPQGWPRWVRKISPPPEFDPWTFQLLASRYTWFESRSESCKLELKLLIFSAIV